MNLLYKGVNTWGINSRVLSPLFEDNLIDKCVFISRTQNDLPNPHGHEFIDISASLAWENNYESYIDRKTWNPLPRYVLEGMQVYEPTCLYLANRIGNFDVYTVGEARDQYLYHLQFWNHILDTEQIDVLIQPYFPHLTWEYVIYCLCLIKSIPILSLNGSHIPGRFAYGNNLENIGDNIFDIFQTTEGIAGFNSIDSDLIQYYQNIRNQDAVDVLSPQFIHARRENAKTESHRFISQKTRILYDKKYFEELLLFTKLFLFNKNGEDRNIQLQTALRKLNTIKFQKNIFKRCRKKYRQQVKSSYYDKVSVLPDYSQKYVYFALQMQPELTSLPNGGVFHDQLLSLEILSKAAVKLGIKIFVKEHFVQISRDKEFYDKIEGLPNVVLIDTSINSLSLIDRCVAVSTQTGSNILEGAIRGKPSIVFGGGYNWKGLPGLIKVDDVDSTINAIKRMLDGSLSVKEEDVKRYFIAINKGTIRNHAFDIVEKNTPQIENDIIQLQNLIKDFLKQHFKKGSLS